MCLSRRKITTLTLKQVFLINTEQFVYMYVHTGIYIGRYYNFGSRFVSRVDKSQEVDYKPCSISNYQIEAQEYYEAWYEGGGEE